MDRKQDWWITQIKSILLIGIISSLWGCESVPEMSITFCESLNPQEHCPESGQQFVMGKPVFVMLSSEDPFVTKKITGRILRVQEAKGELIPLGVKEFAIDPGESFITQSIPFQEFGTEAVGTFKVMFLDEQDQLMAERELTIVHKQQ